MLNDRHLSQPNNLGKVSKKKKYWKIQIRGGRGSARVDFPLRKKQGRLRSNKLGLHNVWGRKNGVRRRKVFAGGQKFVRG